MKLKRIKLIFWKIVCYFKDHKFKVIRGKTIHECYIECSICGKIENKIENGNQAESPEDIISRAKQIIRLLESWKIIGINNMSREWCERCKTDTPNDERDHIKSVYVASQKQYMSKVVGKQTICWICRRPRKWVVNVNIVIVNP